MFNEGTNAMVSYSTFTPSREMQFIAYHTDQLTESFVAKSAFGGVLATAGTFFPFTFVDAQSWLIDKVEFFGIHPVLLTMVVMLYFTDMILGTVISIFGSPRTWCRKVFLRGISKLPMYTVYIILVGILAATLHICFSWGIIITNIFIGTLIATEIQSIIRNFEKMGINVPPILHQLANGFSIKVERRIQDFLDEPKKNMRDYDEADNED